MAQEELGIGLLGCGVVGSAVARALDAHSHILTARLGRTPVLRKVAVRDVRKPRPVRIDPSLLTADPFEVVLRDDVDIVIEVIGGVNPAGALIEAALLSGKAVVTANKELLARRWDCLALAARAEDRPLLFEGAVMAGVPVVNLLTHSLKGDRVRRIEGILNGTTNYCLHRMEKDGLELDAALEEAQALGFAEQDPTADLEGRDAAAKLAILATLAFDTTVQLHEVSFAGISKLTRADVVRAAAAGGALRLVAEAWVSGDQVAARVAPKQLPRDHPLIRVADHYNGLVIESDLSERVFVQGAGAGGDATASAVLSDVVRAGLQLPVLDPAI